MDDAKSKAKAAMAARLAAKTAKLRGASPKRGRSPTPKKKKSAKAFNKATKKSPGGIAAARAKAAAAQAKKTAAKDTTASPERSLNANVNIVIGVLVAFVYVVGIVFQLSHSMVTTHNTVAKR